MFVSSLIRLSTLCFYALVCCASLSADTEEKATPPTTTPATKTTEEQPASHTDKEVVTTHSVSIDGQTIDYKAIAGTLVLKDEKDKPKASIFYVGYFKEGVKDIADRPITFCFNGGPGASSLWLHIGAFGPRRVEYVDLTAAAAPYKLQDNHFSLLDITDLVFVDPVSTGYSRASTGREPKEFFGVDEDVHLLSDFIRLFITRHNRWDSPKFLMGESYGTTRCAALAAYLQRKNYIFTNGIILISSALNWSTFQDENNGNDLPYILYLPSYANVAWYHKRLGKEYQDDHKRLTKEAENFALGDYATALLKGNLLEAEERDRISQELEKFTGISKQTWLECNFRMDSYLFMRQLLRANKEVVGRFDGRYSGVDPEALFEFKSFDPSFEAITGLFTGGFNSYIRQELNWHVDEEYLALNSVRPWNFRNGSSSCLNVAEDLQNTLWHNPHLRVFFASGDYDLALPYFATDYTIAHFRDVDIKARIDSKKFPAGHMMFLNHASLKQLKGDVKQFYFDTLKPKEKGSAKPLWSLQQ